MKASELRIGNLVYQGVDDLEVVEVKCSIDFLISLERVINALCLKPIPLTEEWLVKFVKPIPLTEEWLVKFGFKKIGVNYELNEFVIFTDRKGRLKYRSHPYDVPLYHVHQLQNLYFALRPEELTIKE